jgi:integrase/recombinase XerD
MAALRAQRTTGRRRIKAVMLLARIPGYVAMPKALRHAFGAAATTKSIAPFMIQKWLGHSDTRTTTVYPTIIGREERALARRAWMGLDKSLG